jgi:hypothetical protein
MKCVQRWALRAWDWAVGRGGGWLGDATNESHRPSPVIDAHWLTARKRPPTLRVDERIVEWSIARHPVQACANPIALVHFGLSDSFCPLVIS